MHSVKAVIFDLDDTLYPERAYAWSGFEVVAVAFQDRLGDPEQAAAQMRRLFDPDHRRRVFNAILGKCGLPEDIRLVEAMIETYRTHAPIISLHADADAALTRMRGRFKLGLITDGRAVSQWAKIDALSLRSRFDEIIITSELGAEFAKPHPGAFELMAERLDIESPACAYVADNCAKDFIAPNALGWTTIRIVRQDGIYNAEQPAEHGAPQHGIDTLDSLVEIVN